jgi:hypothetical protein
VLPLPELVDRLADRFTLLDSVNRAADPRHRSLAGTLGWGHDLLGQQERALFTRLAVFPAGFDLAAAAGVGAAAVGGGSADVGPVPHGCRLRRPGSNCGLGQCWSGPSEAVVPGRNRAA